MLNPNTPACWRRLVLIAHTVGVLVTAIPVVYAIRELHYVDNAIGTISTMYRKAEVATELADNAAAGALAISGAVLDLDRDERDRVLEQTDARLAAVAQRLEALRIDPPSELPPGQIDALTAAIGRITDTWKELRDDPEAAKHNTDRAFHFMAMFDEARTVRNALDDIQHRYMVRISDRTNAARDHIGSTLTILLIVMMLAIGLNVGVAIWNHRLLRRTQETGDEIAMKEHALRTQHDRFAAALRHLPHGLIMLDRDFRLVVCNDRYADFYDIPEEMRQPGTTLEALQARRNKRLAGLEDADVTDMVEAVRHNFTAGQCMVKTGMLTDGRIIAIRREGIANGGWIAIHEDVTEIRKAEAERARALEEAAQTRLQERAAIEASRAKSAFLATMSHEIRTPMNALLGLSSTLLESPLDAEQRRAVEAIHDSSDNLLRILNDILDISKLESGKLEFEEIAFAPAALNDNVMSIMAHRAEVKGLKLAIEAEGKLPLALVGDAGRLRQVLLNLVSNAIKFTATGRVVVRARCIHRDDTAATIEWQVVDSGIGIPPERLNTLFDDYVQADASIARRFGGTGLGLAISRRIIQQMGGEIGAESTPGNGATFHFTVTLPLADAAALTQTSARSCIEDLTFALSRLGRPMQVLLAEDNATNQYVVAQMLKAFDIRLTVAADGRKAVMAAERFAYDLVLMDMQMPEMDGFEATRAIRALEGPNGKAPIVALTANAFAEDVKNCLAAGMTDFLAKPVRKPALLAAVLRFVPARSADQATPPVVAIAPNEPAPPIMDGSTFDALCEEIGLDGALETLRVFLAETESRLELLESLSCERDRPTIRNEAHTLKGASSTFGLCELSAQAFDLERTAADITADHYRVTVAALRAAFSRARGTLPDDGPAAREVA